MATILRDQPSGLADPAVVLVACVARKHVATLVEAQGLYQSTWFRYAREVARQAPAWYILSARHGVLHPCSPVSGYNCSLASITAVERLRWAENCLTMLRRVCPTRGSTMLLAGALYAEPLLALDGAITWPLRGLRIGEQVAWMRRVVRGGWGA